ncbi:NrtR DNA-binding winged helix domain-containing protein [Ascidiimonas sp. W6]|uniref:NUDIX hydrolase n=1 Tax=Ascidiimonas meishanensis TaxID=3128903 RepID=UPI0030EB14FF
MENGNLTDNFIKNIENYVPGISLDCVVFGYEEGVLKVLVLKYRNADAWALPGGFLASNVEMQEAATDVLYKRTGLTGVFLTQYHTFSGLNRGWEANEQSKLAMEQVESMWPNVHKATLKKWFHQRFISTAFLALIQANKASLSADHLSECCEWKPISDLPPLVLDHQQMIEMALEYLKVKINYLPIGKSLLPDKFTMYDLQTLYEAILQKRLDRGNFQRKMLKLGIFKRHEKLMTGASNKAPFLYSFNEEAYKSLLEEGIGYC